MARPNTPESTDPYADIPTAMVYDAFTEAANRLTARYTRLSDTAATPEDRAAWWEKVIALRDARRAVPATDRAALIAHIRRWTAALAELGEGRG